MRDILFYGSAIIIGLLIFNYGIKPVLDKPNINQVEVIEPNPDLNVAKSVWLLEQSRCEENKTEYGCRNEYPVQWYIDKSAEFDKIAKEYQP